LARPISVSLHVGVHKTASTHLQKTLARNASLLRDNGVGFVGPESLRQPGQSLQALFGLGDRADAPGGHDAQAQLRRLAGDGAARLVISEENALGPMVGEGAPGPLYPNADLRIERLIRALAPSPVRLFVGLREPAGWLASVYRHKLFNGSYPTFDDFAGGVDPAALRWSNLIERLRRVGGVGRLYIWRQEDYPAVAGPVFRRMLGWKLGPQVARIEGRVNEGLSHKAVEQLLRWGESDDPRGAARKARALFPITTPESRFAPWPAAVLARSRAAYDADIARIADIAGADLLRPARRLQPSRGRAAEAP